MHFRRLVAAALLAAAPVFATPASSQEPVDTSAVRRIREEAFDRSQVMTIASWLTDVHGPRLTGSPIMAAASEWALGKFREWGLVNATMDTWGPFGRGWTNERMVAHVTAPVPFPVIAYPSAWTPGLSAPVTGRVVMLSATTPADFDTYRGTLRGAIVMAGDPPTLRPRFTPDATRLADEELERMAAADPAAAGPGFQMSDEARARMRAQQALAAERTRFLVDEGAAAVLTPARGQDGTVFVGGSGGSRDPASPALLPVISVAAEHYGRIARILEKGLPVTMELDVRNRFHDADLYGHNVLAEIPGTDRADEVDMLGAHFDSWHGATGATDNAAGSAVMMEAVRILKALNLPLRRTVRIALWTGEEQGLLGSRAYVRQTFGTADAPTPAHGKFSAYFNMDNGTGAFRGVWLQGNRAIAPVFEAWMRPFADKGVRTLTLSSTGGTDHLAFDGVGLPGFQFIQDPMDYSSRTHHSTMDTWERLQADDMKLNAAVVAAFVYHAANRAELLPRKPAAR